MKKILMLLLIVGIMGTAIVLPARGQITTFVIENADASNTLSLTGSSTLNTFVNNVADRFVVEFTNATNTFPITPPPTAFTDAINNVADRFVMEFANTSNTFQINYPDEMIQDDRQPLLTNTSTTQAGGSTFLVLTTNEFTVCLLEYGPSSGNYTQSLDDPLFRYVHEFELSALNPGQTYYYRARLTDRAGNITITSESTINTTRSVFLPLMNAP